MTLTEDGYAIARVFRRADIEALQREVASHIDRVVRALNLPYGESHPEAGFDERIERIAKSDPSYAHLLGAAVATDAHRSDVIAQIAADKRLSDMAEILMGAPVGERTVRIRGNSSAMGQHRHDWHSDVSVADGSACSKVRLTAWIPLMDAGPDSGGLEVAAGARQAPLTHQQTGPRFHIAEEDVQNDPKVQVSCPMGSVLFLDRYTPHRALPNLSGKTRWSLVVWMKPAA